MALEPIVLHDISVDQINSLVQKALEEAKAKGSTIFALDSAYLYSIDRSDIPFIRKYTELLKEEFYARTSAKLIHEFHRTLESWLIGDSVTIFDKKIKPLQITRSFDRVTNEMIQKIARSWAGEDFIMMPYVAVGDGADAGSNPSPNDTDLQHEVDRINVLFESGGGALNVEGTTFYAVANFNKNMESCDATESGLFDREKPGAGAEDVNTVDDLMGEHSVFENEVVHEQGENALGITTTVFHCAS